jgi:hypothetical protein
MHRYLEGCIYLWAACCCKWLESFNLRLGGCFFFLVNKTLKRSDYQYLHIECTSKCMNKQLVNIDFGLIQVVESHGSRFIGHIWLFICELGCCIDFWVLCLWIWMTVVSSFALPNYCNDLYALDSLRLIMCSKCKVDCEMQVCAIICSWCWSGSLSSHVRNITWQDQSQGNGNMLGCALGNCLLHSLIFDAFCWDRWLCLYFINISNSGHPAPRYPSFGVSHSAPLSGTDNIGHERCIEILYWLRYRPK